MTEYNFFLIIVLHLLTFHFTAVLSFGVIRLGWADHTFGQMWAIDMEKILCLFLKYFNSD